MYKSAKFGLVLTATYLQIYIYIYVYGESPAELFTIPNLNIRALTESAKVCLHLLPPISDHVTIHVEGYDCSFNEHSK